jgi:hypothetical protein
MVHCETFVVGRRYETRTTRGTVYVGECVETATDATGRAFIRLATDDGEILLHLGDVAAARRVLI